MTIDSTKNLEIWTLGETAELLRVSETTLRRLIEQRKIPFYKIGGGIRFSSTGLNEFLQSNKVETIAKK